jgi:cation diffusion facilitator family transporter
MAASPGGDLSRYALLSVGAALVTIALKTGAYRITGSVGLLSDALESVVNLVGALSTLVLLRVAARPADAEHPHGHSKAEYFASALEGALILAAAVGIGLTALQRLAAPQPLAELGLGLTVALAASALNLAVGRTLRRAGRRHGSIALEAGGAHLLTDVWTSVGVLVGVAAVALTGWLRLDPLVALVVATNIVRTSAGILGRSVSGLMDASLPAAEQAAIVACLAPYEARGITFHALRTRQSGARRFASMHVLVPGDWTVRRGHALLEQLEEELRAAVPQLTVLTHLEPLDDPRSWHDVELDRPPPPAPPPQPPPASKPAPEPPEA